MNPTLKNSLGYSLVEVMTGVLLMGILGWAISAPMLRMQSAGIEQTRRAIATQELDLIITQIRKDIQRHATDVVGIEPVDGIWVEKDLETKCQDLVVRQTILPNGVDPGSKQKIEYKTECNGPDMPTGTFPTRMHDQLRPPCSKAPTLTRTVWRDETKVGESTVMTYPKGGLRAIAVCFRPDTFGTLINVDVSFAYDVKNADWFVAKKTFAVSLSEATAGLEILPPQ